MNIQGGLTVSIVAGVIVSSASVRIARVVVCGVSIVVVAVTVAIWVGVVVIDLKGIWNVVPNAYVISLSGRKEAEENEKNAEKGHLILCLEGAAYLEEFILPVRATAGVMCHCLTVPYILGEQEELGDFRRRSNGPSSLDKRLEMMTFRRV